MERKYVPIENCKNGDIVAEDIVTSFGTVILYKNTELNEYISNRLHDWGIDGIYIYEQPTTFSPAGFSGKTAQYESKYSNNVTAFKKLIKELAEGKKLDIEKFDGITDFITAYIDADGDIINLLDKVKDADEYTYTTHSINVSFYAMLIGKWMKLPSGDIKKLATAGLLHDIGKIRIPSRILNKPEKLLPCEFEVVKKHPILGYDLLNDAGTFDKDVMTAVLFHHEREDGSGYPYNMKGDEIDIYSKIISAADVYEAITSNRVYKRKYTPFDAFKIFLHECINTFDVNVVNTFLNNLAAFYTGSKVMLSSGTVGEVAFIPPDDISKPVIKVRGAFYDLSRDNSLQIVAIEVM